MVISFHHSFEFLFNFPFTSNARVENISVFSTNIHAIFIFVNGSAEARLRVRVFSLRDRPISGPGLFSAVLSDCGLWHLPHFQSQRYHRNILFFFFYQSRLNRIFVKGFAKYKQDALLIISFQDAVQKILFIVFNILTNVW